MAYNKDEIRSVLVQTAAGRLLLPNANVAEVLAGVQSEALDNVPAWLLGRIEWHGWQVPLVSFAQLAGLEQETAPAQDRNNRVVVLKALGGNAELPYFALPAQGFPRLVTVLRDSLLADATEEALPEGVQMRVLLGDEAALLPDLDVLEAKIGQALAQAA